MSDINQAVQPQKMARGLKFRIKIEEELHYLCSENKGADQLRSNILSLLETQKQFPYDKTVIKNVDLMCKI